MNERRHPTVFPGFADIAARRQHLAAALSARRAELGLSQTEVAARMGTSQSAVARLEAGSLDTRLSTLERYVAAVGARLVWQLETDPAEPVLAPGAPRAEVVSPSSPAPTTSTQEGEVWEAAAVARGANFQAGQQSDASFQAGRHGGAGPPSGRGIGGAS